LPLVGQDAQKSLRKNSDSPHYYWLDKKTLLIVLIDRQECISFLQPVTLKQHSDLEKFVHFVQDLCSGQNDPRLDSVRTFTSILLPQWVKKCLQGKRRLLISPHRLLHALPFHALQWSAEDDYLIQHFAVTHVPNLTSLTLPYPVAKQMRVLVLGIQDYQLPGQPDLTPLVEAELEVV
jgi:CHAT domain-containing protein